MLKGALNDSYPFVQALLSMLKWVPIICSIHFLEIPRCQGGKDMDPITGKGRDILMIVSKDGKVAFMNKV